MVADGVPVLDNEKTANTSRFGPIESAFIRGRGTNRDAGNSTQAIGLVLAQATPWPSGQEEGDPPAPPMYVYIYIYICIYVCIYIYVYN